MSNPFGAALEIGGKILDKFVADKDLKETLKADLAMAAMNGELKEVISIIEAQASIIMAEASGTWLQSSWRPLTMIWFSVLLGMYWFGFAPDYLVENPSTVDQLFDLLKIGIGGYIVGRSGEKMMKEYKK